MTNHYQRALDAIEHMAAPETEQVAVVALGYMPLERQIAVILAAMDDADLGELAAAIEHRIPGGAE